MLETKIIHCNKTASRKKSSFLQGFFFVHQQGPFKETQGKNPT